MNTAALMTYAGKYGVRRTVNFIIGLSIGFALLLAGCAVSMVIY